MLMIMSKEDQETWRELIFRWPQPQSHCKCIANIEIQEPVKMKTAQEKAAELLPFVQALANGENVTQSVDGGAELPSNGSFVYGLTYSIKPKMMLVNGFEVPEPMCVAPDTGVKYYTPNFDADSFLLSTSWDDCEMDNRWLSRGLIHSNKEAAIAHAKAMLNIDPNGGE
jgi:hypothetical protein